MSTKQIKPTSGSTRRIQGDPNGQQIRLGLNQEPPSNSRHLQEQIETKTNQRAEELDSRRATKSEEPIENKPRGFVTVPETDTPRTFFFLFFLDELEEKQRRERKGQRCGDDTMMIASVIDELTS